MQASIASCRFPPAAVIIVRVLVLEPGHKEAPVGEVRWVLSKTEATDRVSMAKTYCFVCDAEMERSYLHDGETLVVSKRRRFGFVAIWTCRSTVHIQKLEHTAC